tara:strand:+ start:36 stop:245 length:210 start_codon:yes stop_codon:yes gene_type:complete
MESCNITIKRSCSLDYAFYKLVMNKEKKLHRIKEISEQIVTLKLTKGIKSKLTIQKLQQELNELTLGEL